MGVFRFCLNLKPRLDPAQPVLLAVSGALAGGAGSSLHRLYPVPLTMVLLAKVRFRHRLKRNARIVAARSRGFRFRRHRHYSVGRRIGLTSRPAAVEVISISEVTWALMNLGF